MYSSLSSLKLKSFFGEKFWCLGRIYWWTISIKISISDIGWWLKIIKDDPNLEDYQLSDNHC